jgi:hypothetical protein
MVHGVAKAQVEQIMYGSLTSATGTVDAQILVRRTFWKKQPLFRVERKVKEYCHN